METKYLKLTLTDFQNTIDDNFNKVDAKIRAVDKSIINIADKSAGQGVFQTDAKYDSAKVTFDKDNNLIGITLIKKNESVSSPSPSPIYSGEALLDFPAYTLYTIIEVTKEDRTITLSDSDDDDDNDSDNNIGSAIDGLPTWKLGSMFASIKKLVNNAIQMDYLHFPQAMGGFLQPTSATIAKDSSSGAYRWEVEYTPKLAQYAENATITYPVVPIDLYALGGDLTGGEVNGTINKIGLKFGVAVSNINDIKVDFYDENETRLWVDYNVTTADSVITADSVVTLRIPDYDADIFSGVKYRAYIVAPQEVEKNNEE